MDKIEKFLAYNGKINIVAVETTQLVDEARKTHDLSPLATATLGRCLSIAALMASNMKSEEDKLTLQIKGNGPIGTITVTADNKGRVRGYVLNPQVDLPLKENGKLDVGSAVGSDGFIYVIKDIGLKEPYIGMSKIITGEIAEDFANYYYISEQKNTAPKGGSIFAFFVHFDYKHYGLTSSNQNSTPASVLTTPHLPP